jgi:hypothetical protein
MGMQQNGDSTDRTARVLTGAVTGVSSLAILAGAVSLPAIASPVLVVVFLILIGTSLTGFCPLPTAGVRYLHRLDPIGLILTTVVIFGTDCMRLCSRFSAKRTVVLYAPFDLPVVHHTYRSHDILDNRC